MNLTKDHVEAAKACIGLDTRKPRKKNGKLFYKTDNEPYEVEEGTKEYCLFMDLKGKGYIEQWLGTQRRRSRFSMTKRGLEWLSEETGITIKEKEKQQKKDGRKFPLSFL